MDCKRVDQGYDLLFLGALPEERGRDLREHLATGCEQCRERAREAVQTIYLLSLDTRPVRANPRLKAQVLHRWRKK